LNPIPPDNIEKLKTKYYEENTLQINELTSSLLHDHLTQNQWQSACLNLDNLIQKLSNKIQETCSAPPLPPLTNRIKKQGGFLPRKLQNKWKNTFLPTI